ncbi:MAG: Stf0 family sulfotransferase [Devosia sp.]
MTQSPPPGWTVPLRTIVIATLQRSGSNLLGELMVQTGLLGRPGEFFNPFALRATYPGQGKTLTERFELARQHGATANGVVAIKLFPEYVPTLQSGFRFSEWFGTPVWVWLRRRDLLAQAISLSLAREQGSYISANAPKREPTYSAQGIYNTMRELASRNIRWEVYFARTGIAPIPIYYEEIESDPDRVIRAIGDAAGIELGNFRSAPPAQFQKQRTACNAEWAERFRSELGDPDLFGIDVPRDRWRNIKRRLGLLR